jgi:hypothetical protein
VSLPPRIQSLVDQMIQELGMQACRPSGIKIALDDRGIVQVVSPEVTFRAQKPVDRRESMRST